ncbi:Flavin carrier protein 2 [Hanseniaspora osmophila]|uniref:Flavin carrier protein 2 n=1 Tax=Hanseniaspora osmophila TaxID=56408 RepID=A0A1E5RZU5_9ASCO|nr:Flavin carrier protein 2 [Hanseniaspora osmophila]
MPKSNFLLKLVFSLFILLQIFNPLTYADDDTTATTTTGAATTTKADDSVLGISTSTTNVKNKDPSKLLRTSSLLTCMENSQFSSSFFDVTYFPGNTSVVFNIEAVTTISSKVEIEFQVIAYGLNIIQRSINLCSLNEKSLCPLSAGRIDISSTYQITSDVVDNIPSVAYTVPDLDALVRVYAYSLDDDGNADTSDPVACVLAPLTNGKTVQTKYASWPIAAISGVGVLTSAFYSVMGHSATSAHIASNSISLFVYFQNLAITAMMGVAKVPPIAAAWTQNFQWSMGIINAGFMQKIFKWYVQATGGTSTNILANKSILSIYVQKLKNKLKHKLAKRAITLSGSFDDSVFDDTSVYTTNERNITAVASKTLLVRGIERVAYKADIELSNFFLTGIVFLLFFIFCMCLLLFCLKSLLELLVRTKAMNPDNTKFFEFRKSWGNIIKGTMYRIALIAFPQVTLLCIWEFTQQDSVACMVDSAVILLIILCLMVYGTTRVVIKGLQSSKIYKNPAYLLYGDSEFLNKYGFLYVQFKATAYWWLVPLISYSLLRSLFVAALQTKGKAQSLIVFIIELFYFVGLCVFRPYMDKRTNIFNISIHLINLLNSIFFLFFSNLFGQPMIVSSVMAIVLFVMNAVVALYLLVFTIVTCVLAVLHKNPDSRYQPMKDDRVSFIPRAGGMATMDNKAAELNDLSKAVMVTNETENQKLQRDNAFQLGSQSDSSKRKLLMDDDNEDYELESNSIWSKKDSFGRQQQTQSDDPDVVTRSESYLDVQQPLSSLNNQNHSQQPPLSNSAQYYSQTNNNNNNPYQNFTSNNRNTNNNPYSSGYR